MAALTTKKTLEIFRAGRHVATNGKTYDFSEAQLQEVVGSYNAAHHTAPIVIGHPRDNAPAFGWIASLAMQGASLRAEPERVVAEFAEAVNEGRWGKLSASFYPPDAASNPTPGKWHLRHVGFLGAVPPAVKGLEVPSFAGSADECVEFGELDAATLFRSLREFMIAEFGLEKADKALPPYLVDYVQTDAAVATATETPSSFAEGDPAAADTVPATQETVQAVAEAVTKAVAEAVLNSVTSALQSTFPDFDIEKMQAAVGPAIDTALGKERSKDGAPSLIEAAVAEALKVKPADKPADKPAEQPAAATSDTVDNSEPSPRELELNERERKLVERERTLRRQSHVEFLEGVARAGRRLPVARDYVLDLLEVVSTSEVSFGEGSAQTTPLEVTRKLIQRLPKEVEFAELTQLERVEFGEDADPEDVARAAKAYRAEQHAKGNMISTADAVNHVKGK